MILKLSTCNRRSLLCTCACRAWSLNVFQFVVALLKNFPTSSNSLKNAMIIRHQIHKEMCLEKLRKCTGLQKLNHEVTIFGVAGFGVEIIS